MAAGYFRLMYSNGSGVGDEIEVEVIRMKVIRNLLLMRPKLQGVVNVVIRRPLGNIK